MATGESGGKAVRIETVTSAHLPQLLPLIEGYQRFYEVTPSGDRNLEHFGGLLETPSRGVQFIAFDEAGEAVGFATLYFTLSSVRARAACVLNDLFTVESARRTGVGRQLMAHAMGEARRRGFGCMEWQTHPENQTAQKLYDSLGAKQSTWLTYEIDL